LNRGDEPPKVLLEDVVSGAVLHALDGQILAQRSGDKDEGKVWPPLAGETQGLEPIETRQGMTGEDEVRRALQRREARLARVDTLEPVRQGRKAQMPLDQFAVDRAVLQLKDSDRHGRSIVSRIGGGSFRMAQKMPRS
jgi:hypothetical protein